MELLVKKDGDASILSLSGRLDSNTSADLEKQIDALIDDGAHCLVIDFSNLDYISSAGLRIMLKTSKALGRMEGKFILCAMQDYVKEVFEIAGFHTFLTITPTLDDALAGL